MDAFYASVEQRDFPELRGKPIAVGGGGRRGVVAAASYEARKFGVRSAMPGYKARAACPELIFVKSRFEVYRKISTQIRAIFAEYTDLIEPLSLDEAFLDVTENKKGMTSATLIAEEIRKRIFEELQLTASAGVSFNKFLAKIASDINKPNGIKVITPDEAIPFLEKLPIEKFFGVGKVTAAKMHKRNIFTGADLKAYSEVELINLFGKSGRYYYKMVRAQDDRQVKTSRIRKSLGAERTFFEDINNKNAMLAELHKIAATVYERILKSESFGYTITLKFKSPDFKICTRSKTVQTLIDDEEIIRTLAKELLYESKNIPDAVRLLGITISNFPNDNAGAGEQLSFDF